MPKPLSLAIVGAGIGGLAVAATLRRLGMEARIYEQAPRFARIGAGIQMMPNSMQVLRQIGVDERLRRISFAPYSHLNRMWDTGEITRELPMPESLYGAPYLCMHRADLHEALLSALPPEIIHLDCRLVGLDQTAGSVTLTFADGSRAAADAVIGADGVHSVVRDIVVGPDAPLHRGRIAYRAVFPAELMGGLDIGPSRTKWWGVDRHIVIYYTNARAARSTSSPACRNPPNGSRASPGRPRATWTSCARPTPASTRTCGPCSKPAPTATSGPSWNASRCRDGARAAPCCWATLRIR